MPFKTRKESDLSKPFSYEVLHVCKQSGARLGVLDEAFRAQGKKTFEGIVRDHLKIRDGMAELDSICLVAGLGPENNRRRDGSAAYYLSEPVVQNEAKGVAPLLMCYTEVKRVTGNQ